MAIKRWEPDNFHLETSTVWRFPEHGDWATHDSSYRGNWSPYVPRNLLLRYSGEGDIVLDQFCGGGTTMVECRLLNRIGVGSDVNVKALQLTAKNAILIGQDAGKFIYTNQMHVILPIFLMRK